MLGGKLQSFAVETGIFLHTVSTRIAKDWLCCCTPGMIALEMRTLDPIQLRRSARRNSDSKAASLTRALASASSEVAFDFDTFES